MRILILTSSIFPKEGGLSTNIRAFKKWAEKKQNKVTIISLGSLSRFQRALLLWAPSRLFGIIPGQSGLIILLMMVRLFLRWKVQQLTRNEPFDLVLSQDINAYHAIQKLKYSAKKHYIVVHDYFTSAQQIDWNISSDNYETRYVNHLERTAYSAAEKIFTVDSRIADYIHSKFGIDRNKISIIKNAADCDVYRPFHSQRKDANSFIIFVPRRLVQKNGVEYAIRALSEPILQDDKFVMVIAGEGPEYLKLLNLSKALNLSSRIKFLGSIESKKMPKLYNYSDVVLVPSVTERGIQEATSLSALEAMACEVPVIASRIGGLKEIIDNGINGILVDERDSEQIANAIFYLCSSPQAMINLGTKGRISAMEYWNRYGEEILRIIGEN